MTTLNAAFLQGQFQSTVTATQAEIVLDGAINMLNVYGAGIANLTGAAGTKTGTYTSAEVGKIMLVAQQIYQKHFKSADGANASMGNYGLTYSGDYQLLNFAKAVARQPGSRSFLRT
jgi:hypothetical protein